VVIKAASNFHAKRMANPLTVATATMAATLETATLEAATPVVARAMAGAIPAAHTLFTPCALYKQR
jgi:hypothetical protein